MSTVTLPSPPLLGRNCLVFGVAPTTIDVTGVTLTIGTVVSFLGKFDSVEVEFTANTVEIHAANQVIENNLVVTDGFTARITEIIPANGNSILMANHLSSDYYQVTFQCAPNAGTGTAGKLMTLIGSRKSCTYEIREGKNVAVMTMQTAGVTPSFA